jgi:hypothetical protein
MSAEPDVKFVDVFEWAADGMIRKIESAPIVVTVHLADGSIERPIGPKHPWFKELNARKTEQLQRLRASFKPGDQPKLSHTPQLKKRIRRKTVSTQAADPTYQNENINSRTAK